MRLIEGAIMPDVDSSEVDDLREEIRQLKYDLSTAQREVSAAKRDAARALANLRKQLGPLYQALQMVFGELDAAGVEEPSAASGPVNARTAAVWENWKEKLGLGPGKVIDALLLHGEMNTSQLAIATGYNRKTVPQYVSACKAAGLINKNGQKFSLKKL